MNLIEKQIPHRSEKHEMKRHTGISQPGYRVNVNIFEQVLNTTIRKKVVEELGKNAILHGKKIVVRLDDHFIYLLGELDSWDQILIVKNALDNMDLGRKVINRLTVRPARGIYRFQKNLL